MKYFDSTLFSQKTILKSNVFLYCLNKELTFKIVFLYHFCFLWYIIITYFPSSSQIKNVNYHKYTSLTDNNKHVLCWNVSTRVVITDTRVRGDR